MLHPRSIQAQIKRGGGGGGVVTFLALANMFLFTLWHLSLHLQPGVMLRYDIFSCTCSQVSCYAMTSYLTLAARCHGTLWEVGGGLITFLALANMFHATLWHLLLHLHPGFMLRYDIFSCTCSQVSCYAMTSSSLAFAARCHATLWGVGGRNDVPCTCKHVSCYAMTSSLALAARFHATLWHLLLHLQPGVMLRYDIFSCTCSQVSCYAMGVGGGVITFLALANMLNKLRKHVEQAGWLGLHVLRQKKSGFFQTRVLHMDAKHGWNCEFIASKSCKYHQKWMMVFKEETKPSKGCRFYAWPMLRTRKNSGTVIHDVTCFLLTLPFAFLSQSFFRQDTYVVPIKIWATTAIGKIGLVIPKLKSTQVNKMKVRL